METFKRYEQGNRWCEVGRDRRVFFHDIPCYEIDGRGDRQFFLGDTAPLYVTETPQGWTVGYRPTGDEFAAHADFMVAHGEWK